MQDCGIISSIFIAHEQNWAAEDLLDKKLLIKENKKNLRKEIFALHETFEPEYICASDEGITQRLCESEQYQNANIIFTYVGISNEVATIPIILDALSSGKKVCAPITRGEGIMDAAYLTGLDQLTKNPRGLLEPNENCEIVDPKDIGFVIVPCLSCDPFGNRIGYGGGYYDRYLKKVNLDDACIISACRSRLLSMHLPHGIDDVKMNYYLTEEALVRCFTDF